ncbi:S-adenosyl-L-methionine-dependent methyltransferase [Nemania abortiva]|nr:S-adenosyl-L-methionine-dependent methyltransferase [Nemania abortiva]
MDSALDYVMTRDYIGNNWIWLSDLAKRLLSSVQLDGLDISLHAAPPKQWLPANEFLFVLTDEDFEQALPRLIKLIKSGGYLQWVELDVASFQVDKTAPENESNALSELVRLNQTQYNRPNSTWVLKMPKYLESFRLLEIKSGKREAAPDLTLAMHECNLALQKGLSRNGSCHAFTRWTAVRQKPSA